MRKYSKSAKSMKAMLRRIHWTRGQILPEGGILSAALLFKLIVINNKVRSKPSLMIQNYINNVLSLIWICYIALTAGESIYFHITTSHLPGTAST